MKEKIKKPRVISDRSIVAARDLSAQLGKDIEITVGSEETGGVKSYFSSKLPPLEIDILGQKRSLKVEVSSREQENKTLLHYLFKKTIED